MRVGRTVGIICLLIVGFAGIPFLVGGIANHEEVPNALLIVLAVGGAAILLDLVRRRPRPPIIPH